MRLFFVLCLCAWYSSSLAYDDKRVSWSIPPFLEKKVSEDKELFWFRPFIARYYYSYFLYPLGREHRRKDHFYWSTLFGLFNYESYISNKVYREGLFFPFYFFKKGFGKDMDYAAVWPLGGTVKNFLGKDQADWFMWPLWVKTQNKGAINYWFPWPFLNKRTGQASGFGFWPLGGHFYQKNVYDERYMLWPLIYHHKQFNKDALKKGFLPFYAYEVSPNVKDISIIWPIWGRRWEKAPKYEEYRILWPLWVQGRGEVRNVKRWAPFYSYSENKCLKRRKTWFVWPFIKQTNWEEHGVDIQQEQFLYFVFWHQEQRNHKNQKFLASKTHFWPLYSYWDNGQGHRQLQMLSPFEVFFPDNKMVRDIYTPLFSFYRYDENCGTIKQSFFFNWFNEERTPNNDVTLHCGFLLDYKNTQKEKCFSIFKGLLEYKKINDEKSFKIFWLKLSRNQANKKDHKIL